MLQAASLPDSESFTYEDLTKARVLDAYSTVRADDNAPSTSNRRFVGALGHPSEGETGLITKREWYMDPAVGRFISEDPAGDGGNGFAYCNNDPVNRYDASGKADALVLSGFEWFMATLSAWGIIAGDVLPWTPWNDTPAGHCIKGTASLINAGTCIAGFLSCAAPGLAAATPFLGAAFAVAMICCVVVAAFCILDAMDEFSAAEGVPVTKEDYV